MENKMFCYQCQETAGCKGCTMVGVCGKKPDVAAMQDLLVYVSKGISAVTTALGWYHKLATKAGAGTLVPITGFANAVVSQAIEARCEGYVTGVGAKMFQIAGPVIVYGVLTSTAWGALYYFLRPFI